MNKVFSVLCSVFIMMLGTSCKQLQPAHQKVSAMTTFNPQEVIDDLDKRVSQWAPVTLNFDHQALSANDKQVLKKVVEAAQIAHRLARRQVDNDVWNMRQQIVKEANNPKVIQLFDIMGGPWDLLDHNKPFVGKVERKPGGSFYPADMSKEEFSEHISANQQDKEAFTSYFTKIVRDKSGTLQALWYSEAYKQEIDKMAALLTDAGKLTTYPELKDYLLKRAEALQSNDYYKADEAWLKLENSPIEITFGPYEVYDDALFNYKAIFEAYVAIKDQKASADLKTIGGMMAELDANLPMKDELRGELRGLASPISVVQNIYCGGCAGVQAIAFNLPNDEKIRADFGSKKVMMKNLIDAKYEQILIPIAKKVVLEKQLSMIDAEAFFNDILVHEISHGIGPGLIKLPDGTETDVNKALKDTYPAIEEAKADIGGLVSIAYLEKKDIYPQGMSNRVYATYLAGAFRSVRFGAEEAHAKAVASSFNFLWENGAYVYHPDVKRFSVDFEKAQQVIRQLAEILLEIEATGDYERAQKFLKKYGYVKPEMQALIDTFTGIPVDIAPHYEVLHLMKTW